jgi:hypothetical protein
MYSIKEERAHFDCVNLQEAASFAGAFYAVKQL